GRPAFIESSDQGIGMKDSCDYEPITATRSLLPVDRLFDILLGVRRKQSEILRIANKSRFSDLYLTSEIIIQKFVNWRTSAILVCFSPFLPDIFSQRILLVPIS